MVTGMIMFFSKKEAQKLAYSTSNEGEAQSNV